ncbi:hypothetical protein [Desulfovermiculus halophilus]|jgi:hypothetical protein|nr:hypothetical protein [Desulfovermiculus halophilus]
MDIDPDSDFDPEEKNPNKPMHWTLILLSFPRSAWELPRTLQRP